MEKSPSTNDFNLGAMGGLEVEVVAVVVVAVVAELLCFSS